MSNLQNFITAQQAARQTRPDQQVDWSLRKEKWLSELNRLFGFITSKLTEAGVSEEQIESTHHRINEETLGSYVAPGLKVDIGPGWVTFVPIGSVILGGYGRVDVKGPARDEIVKLIADDADIDRQQDDQTPSHAREWIWKVYPERGTRNNYSLDEDGLTRLLQSVLEPV